jgi:branched-subunit amino acid transport protein
VTAAWQVVILLGMSTALIKAAGPVALGGRGLPPKLVPMLGLVAPALFAALTATQTFARGSRVALDARALGLLAAVLVSALRAPAPLVILAAVTATAACRLLLP